MSNTSNKRGFVLLASTSMLALSLAAAAFTVEFELDRPVLAGFKTALADGGEVGEAGDDDSDATNNRG